MNEIDILDQLVRFKDKVCVSSELEVLAADEIENLRIDNERLRAERDALRAELAAERETYTDPNGRTWHRPSARGYSQVMKVLEERDDEIEQLDAELAAAHGTADDIYKKVMEARAERGALLGLLREAHVKMVENNLWRNLRARIDALLNKGGGDD